MEPPASKIHPVRQVGLALAGAEVKLEAAADAQGDGGLGDRWGAGGRAELECLEQGTGDDAGFHEGEIPADAEARADAEGHVGGGWRRKKAVGIELIRLFPELRVAVEGVGTDDDGCPCGDGVAGDFG